MTIMRTMTIDDDDHDDNLIVPISKEGDDDDDDDDNWNVPISKEGDQFRISAKVLYILLQPLQCCDLGHNQHFHHQVSTGVQKKVFARILSSQKMDGNGWLSPGPSVHSWPSADADGEQCLCSRNLTNHYKVRGITNQGILILYIQGSRDNHDNVTN